ncbi:serine/threonine-protein kinase [Luedemannella helvata]|uniref:Protein kinase domain-containing protein n=1 Tax=Luedemannella helvata TaxID=349315 RepID=A0ABN2JX78_9ACTN
MTPLEPSDPRALSGYRLVCRVAAGGMGQVYLAVSPSGTPAAVKVILPGLAGQPEFRARFRREVRAARQVRSPYVAEVLDADADGAHPWLATEYVAGPSLAAAVRTFGPLPSASVTALGAGIVAALREVERAGLVHRDLKPSNVLLDAAGPRLIDFGIAKAADATSLTRTGYVVGTAGYIAPEQIHGGGLAPAADVFSLGAVLTFALTGVGPFGAGPPQVLIGRVLYAEPDLDAAPAQWRDLLNQCLAKDPAERPTLAALAERLDPTRRGVAAAFHDGWLPPAVSAAVRERVAAARHDIAADPAPATTTAVKATPAARPDAAPTSRRRSLIAVAALLVAAAAVVTVAALRGSGAGPGPDPTSPPAESAVAADYLGTWAGDLHQADIDRTYPVRVTLNGGRVGAVVGTVHYPAPGCSGELRLAAVGDEGVRVTETISKGSADCLTPVPLLLTARPSGELTYRAIIESGNPPVTGTLSRVAGQLPATLVGTWRGTVQPTDDDRHEVVVVIYERSLRTVGTIEYPSRRCRAPLTADLATATAGWFTEGSACYEGLVVLTLAGDGSVRFRWIDPDNVEGTAATGTLVRG